MAPDNPRRSVNQSINTPRSLTQSAPTKTKNPVTVGKISKVSMSSFTGKQRRSIVWNPMVHPSQGKTRGKRSPKSVTAKNTVQTHQNMDAHMDALMALTA